MRQKLRHESTLSGTCRLTVLFKWKIETRYPILDTHGHRASSSRFMENRVEHRVFLV